MNGILCVYYPIIVRRSASLLVFVTVVPASGRPAFALCGPRGLTVVVRRAARGLYALAHPGHRDHQARPCVRGSQRRALTVAARYARRFA